MADEQQTAQQTPQKRGPGRPRKQSDEKDKAIIEMARAVAESVKSGARQTDARSVRDVTGPSVSEIVRANPRARLLERIDKDFREKVYPVVENPVTHSEDPTRETRWRLVLNRAARKLLPNPRVWGEAIDIEVEDDGKPEPQYRFEQR